MKIPSLTYTEIYADASNKTKNQINDSRLEILEIYESLRSDLKILEIYLHALGDAWMAKK